MTIRIPNLLRSALAAACIASVAVATAPGTSAQDIAAPANPYGVWNYARTLRAQTANLRNPEGIEMLVAILTGRLGPGEGWFHPSEMRYSWESLAKEYDTDKSGQVTFDELPASKVLARRLDRNGDETLTADDFDWSDRSAFARDSGISGMWFRQADGDSNGKLSREEWNALFEAASKKKGFLTPADLREAFPLAPPRRPAAKTPSSSGPSTWVLLQGLVTGEIGSWAEGPKLDQPAPDFTLATQDGKRKVSLADYRDKKPVVLIFGSFT